jgi:phage/plasmid-associated DNA primase
MTRADIMAQILSEVTGKPKDQVTNLLERFKEIFSDTFKFDEELSDEEAEQTLQKLRKEKSGILNWLLEGTYRVHKRTGNA